MGFGQAIAAGFTNYFNFKDRSTRSAYWYFILFLFLASIVTAVADLALFEPKFEPKTVGPINGIFSLATFIPSLALAVRRLHDIDRSGWWVLLGLIPIIGWIILIVWACQPTAPQPNRYGPPPAA